LGDRSEGRTWAGPIRVKSTALQLIWLQPEGHFELEEVELTDTAPNGYILIAGTGTRPEFQGQKVYSFWVGHLFAMPITL